jgi:hypothetical protein
MKNLKNLDRHAGAETSCVLIAREGGGILLFQEPSILNRSGETPELSNRMCRVLAHVVFLFSE